MPIRPEQLPAQLERGLKRAYLICGDEPLLVSEAADAVREAARAAGFEERSVFHVDSQFDFAELSGSAQTRSLFSSRRLLDVRMPTGRPGRQGSDVLRELATAEDPELLLLITTGKLDASQLKAAWARALQQHGLVVRCFPVAPRELPGWLAERMRARGLQPDRQAVLALAQRVEGNLLAAAQEIDKLLLLEGPGPVSAADITGLVADSARFELFLMLETALSGRGDRAIRMARGLRAEAAPEAVVAAVLARELRLLLRIRLALDQGTNLQAVYRAAGVWESRRLLLERAVRRRGAAQWRRLLARAAQLDRAVKGLDPQAPWSLVEELLLGLAGVPCAGR